MQPRNCRTYDEHIESVNIDAQRTRSCDFLPTLTTLQYHNIVIVSTNLWIYDSFCGAYEYD